MRRSHRSPARCARRRPVFRRCRRDPSSGRSTGWRGRSPPAGTCLSSCRAPTTPEWSGSGRGSRRRYRRGLRGPAPWRTCPPARRRSSPGHSRAGGWAGPIPCSPSVRPRCTCRPSAGSRRVMGDRLVHMLGLGRAAGGLIARVGRLGLVLVLVGDTQPDDDLALKIVETDRDRGVPGLHIVKGGEGGTVPVLRQQRHLEIDLAQLVRDVAVLPPDTHISVPETLQIDRKICIARHKDSSYPGLKHFALNCHNYLNYYLSKYRRSLYT